MEKKRKRYQNRYKCYSLVAWQKYLSRRSRWQNRTAIEMLEELGSKARSFYKSFSYWVSIVYLKEERKEKIAKLFLSRTYDYSRQRNGRKGQRKLDFHSLEEWIKYKEEHSEWENKSSTEMIAMKGESSSFYFLFYAWLKENHLCQKRLEILKNVFPRKKPKKRQVSKTA